MDIFPDQPLVLRLLNSVLMKTDDDWRAEEHRFFSETPMNKLLEGESSLLLAAMVMLLPPAH